jgi:hypothetical protein
MCDYSLHAVASRPAKVGDRLVTTCFRNTFTRGFCSIEEPGVAVCLRPGTEIVFKDEPKLGHPLRWLRSRFGFHKTDEKLGERTARFRQINMSKPHVHHDVVEFANGNIVLVTKLAAGLHVTVLQLPASLEAVRSPPFETPEFSLPER